MKYTNIYIATGNPSKLRDFQQLFSWINPEIQVEMIPEKIEVEYYGRESYKQILEYQTSDGKWKADSEYGALFKPFWKKKTIKYFQNNLL